MLVYHEIVSYRGRVSSLQTWAVGGSPSTAIRSRRGLGRPAKPHGVSYARHCPYPTCTDRRSEDRSIPHHDDAHRGAAVRLDWAMRDLTRRSAANPAPAPLRTGIAFEIADLLLVRSWADLHDCRAVVI